MSRAKAEPAKILLKPVVKALEQGLTDDLVAVALFGSRARGDAEPESDWDLLIIAHNLPKRMLPRHFYLKSMLPREWCARISLLAKTPQEFEAQLPSLYLDIALDALVLFDPQGYLHEKFRKLCSWIDKMGLRRERLNGDWVWRWQQNRPVEWAPSWENIR
ncbi:MAG: nucleotidyltransferase domain-containing protein [candidate division KSB1 bacterium]|nr:nucleotidyltransferase domain-containing protein [candidate division KSB1 bacterium]